MKFIWIILGLIITGIKGMSVVTKNDSYHRWKADWGGFKAPEMDPHWARVGKEGRITHTLTNIIVEWNRLDAQRGAKFMMGLALLWMILAIVGWLV